LRLQYFAALRLEQRWPRVLAAAVAVVLAAVVLAAAAVTHPVQ